MNPVNGPQARVYRGAFIGEEKPRAPRDRYFDTLRATALVRVVVYHMFPLPWLAMIFPSMGVMFALGGSLMATSMRRSTEQAITGRLRRLLPALWVMGVLLIPVILVAGWDDRPDWPVFLLWLFPIVEPPAAEWAEPVTGVLWYLVAYLWLVLLSPLLIRCYRRARLVTVGCPVAGLFLMESLPQGLGEALGSAVTDVLTFMACWVLGFAHRAGDLKRVHLGVLAPLSAILVGAGLAWTISHPGEDGVDLSAEPMAYAVYSVGFVLLLLRINPTMRWLARRRFLDGFVNLCNARAVTIYLWHNTAITLCFTVGSAIAVDRVGPRFEMAAFFAVALVLLGGIVAVLGWVEDVAARRPVRLMPWSAIPPSRPRPVTEWSGPI